MPDIGLVNIRWRQQRRSSGSIFCSDAVPMLVNKSSVLVLLMRGTDGDENCAKIRIVME